MLMEDAAKKKNNQTIIWAILGPLLFSSLLVAILLHPASTPWGLPFAALMGVLACHVWGWRGMAMSTTLLLGVLAYYLSIHSSSLWLILVSLCIASTFIVTLLCSEECQRSWELLAKAVEDSKQTIRNLNERANAIQSKLLNDQGEFSLSIERLKREIIAKDEKLHSGDRLVALARDELSAVYANQEKLIQELFQLRQESATLKVTVEELRENASESGQAKEKALLQSKYEARIKEVQLQCQAFEQKEHAARQQLDEMTVQLKQLKQEKVFVEQQYAATKAEEINLLHKLESLSQQHSNQLKSGYEEIQKANGRLSEMESRYQGLLQDSEKLKETADLLLVEKAALANQLQQEIADAVKQKEELVHEKESLAQQLEQNQKETIPGDDKELRRIEGLYQQLRKQFQEKAETLTATRRELFKTREKLMALQKDLEEAKIHEENETNDHLHSLLAAAEQELAAVEREHGVEIAHLHEVIDSLITQVSVVA